MKSLSNHFSFHQAAFSSLMNNSITVLEMKQLYGEASINGTYKGVPLITSAIIHNNFNLFLNLIDDPTLDINQTDMGGDSPLRWMIRKHRKKFFQYFLNHSDVDWEREIHSKKELPLHLDLLDSCKNNLQLIKIWYKSNPLLWQQSFQISRNQSFKISNWDDSFSKDHINPLDFSLIKNSTVLTQFFLNSTPLEPNPKILTRNLQGIFSQGTHTVHPGIFLAQSMNTSESQQCLNQAYKKKDAELLIDLLALIQKKRLEDNLANIKNSLNLKKRL